MNNTIQLEGFREGVDDVRYLPTLLNVIVNSCIRIPKLAIEAQTWLNNIDLSGDLDELRREIINWIIKLQNQ